VAFKPPTLATLYPSARASAPAPSPPAAPLSPRVSLLAPVRQIRPFFTRPIALLTPRIKLPPITLL
jgi:hypothetical protein